jgi:hypothetical protein
MTRLSIFASVLLQLSAASRKSALTFSDIYGLHLHGASKPMPKPDLKVDT